MTDASERAQSADVSEHAGRTRLLMRAKYAAMPVPDAVLAILLAAIVLIAVLPPDRVPLLLIRLTGGGLSDDLAFAMMIEGGFLFLQSTLVDVATRLRQRPPIWSIPLIGGTLLLFTGGTGVLQGVADRGGLVLIPVLISLAERFTVLWFMPERSPLERIAARAQASNRIDAAFVALLTIVLTFVGEMTLPPPYSAWTESGFFLAGAIYFGLAAYDAVRVRGRKFAQRQTVLLGFDPLGIHYLEPV